MGKIFFFGMTSDILMTFYSKNMVIGSYVMPLVTLNQKLHVSSREAVGVAGCQI
jgi:hypothetical protein